MIAILTALLRPLFEAAVSAFGRTLLDALKTWQAQDAAKKQGRAEAERDIAIAAADVVQEMDTVPQPDDAAMIAALRRGEG